MSVKQNEKFTEEISRLCTKKNQIKKKIIKKNLDQKLYETRVKVYEE
jgi:hypothetical protein